MATRRHDCGLDNCTIRTAYVKESDNGIGKWIVIGLWTTECKRLYTLHELRNGDDVLYYVLDRGTHKLRVKITVNDSKLK